jgi:DNA recombination protein RmuC
LQELLDNNLGILIVFAIIFVIILIFLLFLLNRNIRLKDTILRDRTIYESHGNLEEQFKNISNEILIKNHYDFINIAKETFEKILNNEKVENEKRQNSFVNMINPIQETLTSFNDKISQLEKERIASYSDLRRQVSDLMLFQQEIQKETASLNKALSTPFMSGQWGEMQLLRVIEISGMMAYCDFIEQKQEEKSRPDMIIKLPGNRNIIVDAKAPIDAYMQAVNTGDESYLELHAKRIKARIRELGQKSYWEQFAPTPEFVLMFLPGESFFSSAIKMDPSLIEYGVREKVIITTPITLIAILKAISFSWQQEAMAANAKKIGEIGKAVYYSLEELLKRTKKFEKEMHRNVEDYEKINNFIEKKITPAARNLKTLGLEVVEESQDSSEDPRMNSEE